MVDMDETTRVCCMCGDVGFTDKLFRCIKCRHRLQHSYCSNYYYGESASPDEIQQVCDWCQTQQQERSHINSSSKIIKSSSSSSTAVTTNRSEYSGDKIIKHHHNHREEGKSPTPSPRPTTRRYKLLKDVMC